MIELLRRAAGEVADQPLVLSAERSVTYAECVDRAEAIARGLAARSIDRFACRLDDAGSVIALLAAASATGAESCVYPAALDDREVSELATAFEHDVVLTEGDVDDLAVAQGDLPPAPVLAPILILTTGTTGRPKGARHDWNRLIATVRHPDERRGTRWLLAYNLNQFAGIQVLVHVLLSRATLVVGASRQPLDALAAIRDFSVTHVSGTPTFWRLLAPRLDDEATRDLRLEQITIGGEAVPPALLDQLRRRLPSTRISQIYGATEFGTAVSVRDGRPGLPLSVLERGDDAEVQFRIVDGELHARSRVGMLGYHDEAGATEGGWRATGDLVDVQGDRIHFVGRSTDIINVGGVKVHPLPVEEAVGTVDGVRLARVYGRANPIAGQVVAVDVVADTGVDSDALKERIRAACADLPPAAQPRRVRFVDELPVSGEKIVRSAEPAP